MMAEVVCNTEPLRPSTVVAGRRLALILMEALQFWRRWNL